MGLTRTIWAINKLRPFGSKMTPPLFFGNCLSFLQKIVMPHIAKRNDKKNWIENNPPRRLFGKSEKNHPNLWVQASLIH